MKLEISDFSKVTAISNEGLLNNFNFYLNKLYAQHERDPHLFKSENWKKSPDKHKRQQFFDYYNSIVKTFPWNNEQKKVSFFLFFLFFFSFSLYFSILIN
jgi:hypothetical protein